MKLWREQKSKGANELAEGVGKIEFIVHVLLWLVELYHFIDRIIQFNAAK